MVTFTVGEVGVTEVVENDMTIEMGLAFTGLAGEEAELDALREGLPAELFDDAGRPVLIFRSYVLRAPGGVVVLDTCWGNRKERRLDPYAHMLDTGYLAGLAAAGVDPAEVDYVFCTHLHQDHVGWNTRWRDGAWMPTFPNAAYLLVRAEYEHWTTVSAGNYGHDSFADSVQPIVAAGLHRWIEPGAHIDDALRVLPLPGHTPGHCGLHVSSGGEEAVFTGDLFHTAYQFARPDWSIVSEHDTGRGPATRREFMDRHAGSGVRIVPAHFNAPAGGTLARAGDGYGFTLL